MIKEMLKFCNKEDKSTESSSAFSDFFTESSAREKKKIIKETVKNANEDQRELVEKASRGEEACNTCK